MKIKHKYFLNIYIIILLIFCYNFLFAKDDNKRNDDYMFNIQKELAKGRHKQLFEIFNNNLCTEEKQALQYLYAYMPISDLADYSGDYFLSQIKYTLKAKKEMAWSKSIPEDIFLHFVLPIRVNNENLDMFRSTMYDELANRIKGLSMKDAALEINHWCHEKVTYKGSDYRTSSPLATMKTSWGRCGEESVFTVNALRTVGLPARQVYTPRWAHSDDNHAWVEVWVDGKWYFLGACEPEPDLDMGWFAEPARRAMLLHTRCFGQYLGNEPVILAEDRFSELNLTYNYAPTKQFFVKITNEFNAPVDSAKIEYQLYNYSEYFPIATNFTDINGLASINTGLGDLIVWANKANKFGFKKISVANTDTVFISISDKHNIDSIYDFTITPPPILPIKTVNQEGRDNNNKKLKLEDEIRSNYMATFKDSLWAANLAKELNIDSDSTVKLIKNSFGNWKEIEKFLRNNTQNRYLAVLLLNYITEKDLRDCNADVLQEHLDNSLLRIDKEQMNNDINFYVEYIISPRISNELIRAWRSFLFEKMTAVLKNNKPNVNEISQWIYNNIQINNQANLHSRSPLSPRGVFELKVADNSSRNIFFVAVCRTFNIPARINPATDIPQYFENNQWINQNFGSEIKNNLKGFIHFTNKNNDFIPQYYKNFTIARFDNGTYKTLDLEFSQELNKFPEKMEVEIGEYMLVTGNRLEDCSVLSTISFFNVYENMITDVNVAINDKKIKNEIVGIINPDNIWLNKIIDNKEIKLSNLLTNSAVFIFISPDKEPSKHVLADIPLSKNFFENWNGEFIYVLEPNTTKSFKPENFPGQPKNSFYANDINSNFLKEISKTVKNMTVDNYPIVLVIDSNNSILYFSQGYKIGINEQIIKTINAINK